MNYIDVLKQYKLDGLLEHIEIWILKDVFIRPTNKTIIFNNNNSIMLTDVYLYSIYAERLFFNRWIINNCEIIRVDI
ncbi:hypothetical protein HN02_01 [Clostridium phage vB_CpeP_HN02]|uniref:Uncharacterized protein n=1 Tax=Clostridium phage vB_CpeP_HN02 TaxID=2834252 RepID=A0A8E6GSI0_9CAUD|nr:hypothetical protein HN02_01 [Clostridium phage vB_CpeP_HN02]